MVLGDWIDRFAFWEGFHPDLQNLLIYGAGIALYTAFVFAFYQAISRRDPLHRKLQPGWWGKVLHGAETALTFPVISFGYFALISLALFLLSKPDKATAQILLLSMAAVLGVRVTAHVSENMSNDLAKLLPLSLIAVVLVEPGYLGGLGTTFGRIGEALGMISVLFQYFVLFIVVEAALRAVRAFGPTFAKATHRVKRHGVSKRAMMRDIEGRHEHHLFGRHHSHTELTPVDRSRDFVALDEGTGGKPGSRQGVGPAIKHELPHSHAPTGNNKPRAGPGGSG